MKNLLLVLALIIITKTNAQQLQSPAQFLGYSLGDKFTPHNKIVEYFKAVATASPAVVKLLPYGKTNEGRELLVAVIASAENMQRLNDIKASNLSLINNANATPVANQPSIVWLSYNVHGNEPSSSEAAMQTLYSFADPSNIKTKQWLANTIVIIDPCLNPDGRDRYVNWFNNIVGTNGNVDPQSREHNEPWPGGRVNHYYFDLNRDWAWQTQIETQQRLKLYNEWNPQVHVDFHEQYYNSPYYFAPAAEPFHEVITPWQREFQTTIGRSNAKYFDENGWLYFTKEIFDLFYPSYGDTYPIYNGAIGMTYEQGGHSRGGLGVIKNDGDTLTLAQRVMHHYTTGLSTVEVAAANHDKLLSEFKKYFDDSRAATNSLYKTYIVTSNNKNKIQQLQKLLTSNNIIYGTTTNKLRGYNYATGKDDAVTYKDYTIAISAMQPKGRLAQVLLEPQSKLNDTVTYDITAWSLPYVYGLDAYAVKDAVSLSTINYSNAKRALDKNVYGYLINYNSFTSAQLLAYLLKNNLKVRASEKPFIYKGKQYLRGTLILLNTKPYQHIIEEAYNKFDVSIDGVETGFMDTGVDFGSESIGLLQKPVVAMISGQGSDENASGEVWYFFEKELNYPVSVLNANDISYTNLSKYNVLVIPNGYYKLFSDKNTNEKLKDFVRDGGKIIALENAVSQMAQNDWGFKLKEDKNDDKKEDYADLKKYADRERDAITGATPGAIFKAQLDVTHPLAFGYDSLYYTLKRDANVYEFLKDGWNVGVIKKNALAAGFAGSKIKQKIADGTIIGNLQMNNGNVIFMADDPLFRDFWENGKLLLSNAIFMVR